MTVVQHLVVVVHLLGMAALVGGWLALRLDPESNRLLALLVWGARLQVITGIILVGLIMAADDPINHMKVGIKFLIALAAAACAEIAGGRARRGQPNIQALRDGAGLAGVLNVLVAVLWT
ncbi:hypothetical protein [Millisia brevis]|uniref:hypothetical protein n=1 Tax=Millisia brevis TaxID=264148 RepID=UPI000830122E|nr:hypothetical protein [Millisia brevis]